MRPANFVKLTAANDDKYKNVIHSAQQSSTLTVDKIMYINKTTDLRERKSSCACDMASYAIVDA